MPEYFRQEGGYLGLPLCSPEAYFLVQIHAPTGRVAVTPSRGARQVENNLDSTALSLKVNAHEELSETSSQVSPTSSSKSTTSNLNAFALDQLVADSVVNQSLHCN